MLSRKLRLLLSGTAVILAVMFMAGALVLNATLQRSFDNAFAGAYSGVDIQVTKSGRRHQRVHSGRLR